MKGNVSKIMRRTTTKELTHSKRQLTLIQNAPFPVLNIITTLRLVTTADHNQKTLGGFNFH